MKKISINIFSIIGLILLGLAGIAGIWFTTMSTKDKNFRDMFNPNAQRENYIDDIEKDTTSVLGGLLYISPNKRTAKNITDITTTDTMTAFLTHPTEVSTLPATFTNAKSINFFLLNTQYPERKEKDNNFKVLDDFLDIATPEQQEILKITYENILGEQKPYIQIKITQDKNDQFQDLSKIYDFFAKIDMTKYPPTTKILGMIE